MDTSMSPEMVTILNSARRILNGRDEWNDFAFFVEKGLSVTEQLKQSINSLMPTIYREQGAPEIKYEINNALSANLQILEMMLKAAADRDTENLVQVCASLDENALRISKLLVELEGKKSSSFRASSSDTLNDIILIGIEVSRKSIGKEHLVARLPELQRYINYVENTIQDSFRRFNDQKILRDFFEEQLQRLKQGAGGIFLFLESDNTEELAIAVSLLDRAGLDLWAAFSALNQLYFQHQQYSGNQWVDNAFHFLKRYKSGEFTSSDMISALLMMKSELDRESFEVSLIENRLFLKAEDAEEFIPQFRDSVTRMELVLAYMYDNITDFEALEEALGKYDLILEQYVDLRNSLADRLKQGYVSPESAHFEELLSIIRSVFENKLPDIKLESKVLYMDAFQEEFRARLALEARRNPEVEVTVDRFFELLDQQRGGLDLALDYLETGNREVLRDAYKVIEESTRELVKYHNELEKYSKSDNQDTEIACPFCGMNNPRDSKKCSNCSRTLQIRSEGEVESGESLNITEAKGTLTSSSSGLVLPDNIEFIRQVVEDTVQGILPFEESEEMLLPHWERICEVEHNLDTSVARVIDKSQDPDLSRDYETFKNSLSFFQSSMNEIIIGLQERNATILRNNLPSVIEAGEEIYRLHKQFHVLAKNKDE